MVLGIALAQVERKEDDIELSMFIPCFNESKFIKSTVREVLFAIESLGLTFELISCWRWIHRWYEREGDEELPRR